MKRETFEIKYENTTVKKHKWNSSIRETERLVGEIAKLQGCKYHLVGSESHKEGFSFTHGSRTWQNDNKDTVKFEIKKVS